MSTSETQQLLDGLAIGYLPEGLGAPSDFEFEWGDVRFVQRVWETQVEEGVWRVDLQVQAMRGTRLGDREGMRAFLSEYHERGDDWRPEPFGEDGLKSEREVARLIEPGLAVEVRDPFDRQGMDEVGSIATAISQGRC